jgi:endogenous inhibitor of DNA gyrase (YacG/DUF329 family)
MKKNIECPTCGEASEYTPENPNRPFCSERCKLIDLGEWASESYQIPTQPSLEDYEDFSTGMESALNSSKSTVH